MIRTLFGAAAAACLIAAPGLAAAPRDWSKVVTATADGGYVMGNPKAAASLVEYGSYTCPHCKAFHDEGMPTLRARYIAPGRMRFEFRSFVRNGPDIAASLLARCVGPQAYYRAVDRFYALQDKWTEPYVSMTGEQARTIEGLAPDKQILPLARVGKLDAFLRPVGLTPAKAARCLTDGAGIKALTDGNARAVEVFGLTGTPTFVLDGATLKDTFDWGRLAPQLPR